MGGLGNLPSSAPSGPLPPCALFHFLFATSTEKVHVGAGMGGRVITGTVGEEPPVWAVSKSSKSEVFSFNPMPSGMSMASWLALTCASFRCLRRVLGASSRSSC